MDEITITIYPTENDGGGYGYDIYNTELADAMELVDALAGGQCTGSFEDALRDYPITVDDIRKVFRNKNFEVCATIFCGRSCKCRGRCTI